MNKKTIASLVAGVIILGGAVTPFIAQAADQASPADIPEHHQMDPDKFAQNIADTYGISKDEILKYQQNGASFRDLSKAAFLAKASNKPLGEVLTAKTAANSWKSVANSLGVTREKVRAVRQDITATQLETKLSIPKQASLDLMNQGYRSQDIAVANELAKNTNKPIADILSMRQINNTWQNVSQTLGINDAAFTQDMKNIQVAFPHHGFHGHNQGNRGDK